mmetsp:Transcript_11707/g.13250  ORF Transcript_11707/g.13250 Transcript_11707/m.13250 type:complete len:383 (+) Transcript_11707:38-1186(+)|eukprot:CAMPEP_0205828064 /NCGR_PEP_ID=MMETSP0206-20130828/33986_1 /ASSEMBLY_ACC=CAM_ASM_000279 /TAXON_ID=36767 /ORGANISM="Euplotes focardii, Strain TN1" /LENGTH=382 /DNA_ID=CAMNT_0053129525 /DNA_START=34 /DNA_END=1182 /DNA_ORIENTATION=-
MSDTTLTIIQITFIIFIYFLAFGAGILPNLIPWCKNSINVLGIANAFSGGVFLAIALMHILPEATSGYAEYMENDPDESQNEDDSDIFPLPFALTFVGYAFILLIDKVIFDTHSLVGEHHHHHLHDPAQVQFVDNFKESLKQNLLNQGTPQEDLECINNSEVLAAEIKAYLSRNDKFAVRMNHALHPSHHYKSRSFYKPYEPLENPDGLDKSQPQKDLLEVNEDEISLSSKPSKCSCNLTPVVLMIALSTHSVFEGIATGLVSELGELWTYVIAISLHKWAAAMSLGISMSKNFKNETKTMYLCLFIFSLATPLGVGIGMAISTSSELLEIVFSSLAAGTFVYIACSEVIVEEFSIAKFKWFKMLAFVFGALLITSLNFLES